MSQLMVEVGDEDQILELASTAVPALAPATLAGILLNDGSWTGPSQVRSEVVTALEGHGISSRPITLTDIPSTFAYSLTSLRGHIGYLVVGGNQSPSEAQQFLLRALAQQTGAVLGSARLHEMERQSGHELEVLNRRLEETVDALRRGMDIHGRLTDVAVSGAGRSGIAEALHDVTGYPIAIEDRYGNLTAWAGPDRPHPYPKDSTVRREQLLRRIVREGKPVRDGGRLVAIARPRPDLIGTVVLIDPAKSCGEQELMALEHGTTVLAMELARLRSLAESELRVRRDLVEELLAGTDTDSALQRAQALGYDLQRPHRVVIVEGRDRAGDQEAFFHGVRRAARDEPVGTLLVMRGDNVVILADHDADWNAFRLSVLRQIGGGRCKVGVGERCERFGQLPRSHRHAELALQVQAAAGWGERANRFEDLGVFQLLATTEDSGEILRFIDHWLGSLRTYDTEKGSDLVQTLACYLENGGSYEASSEALNIHRSTLKYRLQRIREISEHDLKDPDTRFNLQLATRAQQTLAALRAGPSSVPRS